MQQSRLGVLNTPFMACSRFEASQLYEPPFNQIHYEGIDGVFGDADADKIFGVVEAFNESTVA